MYPDHILKFESVEVVEEIMKGFLEEYETQLLDLEGYLVGDIVFACRQFVSKLDLFNIRIDLGINEVVKQCMDDIFYFKNDQCIQFLAFEIKDFVKYKTKLSFIDLSKIYKKCVLYWVHIKTIQEFKTKYPH